VVICTDTFWRNAWKYRARAYRHSGWDTGVILSNLLATAVSAALPARIVCGFADEEVNRLLSIDGAREAAVALVALDRGEQVSAADRAAPVPVALSLPTTPLSRAEVEYPLIREIHAASSLRTAEVSTWRGAPPARLGAPPAGRLFPLGRRSGEHAPADALDAVIKRRGSSRRFTHEPIALGDLSALLRRSTLGVPADFLDPPGAMLNDMYLIVHAVDGLPPGAYVYHRQAQALEQLREGEFRGEAGYLALEQALARDAAVNIYYLAALDQILERFGNRGYRAVQLEAGILGGKVYLLSYALGLGATGLTFYDDDVVRFFSPHASGKSVMFLMAVGHSAASGRPLRSARP
jgi:SagB-type dehydrogenase family enzyme